MEEKIKHWWNCTKYLKKFEGEEINSLRMYYVQRCRNAAEEHELPKQNFGPSVMCSHCGSFWSKNKFKSKIIPGKSPSKSVKHIIESCSKNERLSRFQATLMKKSLKNKSNKVVIKCLVCMKNTVISCDKPKRLKLQEKKIKDNVTMSQKKKKRKLKDKTAGLNLSSIESPTISKKKETESEISTSTEIKVKKPKGKTLTPIQNVRKLNLAKLNNVLNNNKPQKPRNSLTNFLKELY